MSWAQSAILWAPLVDLRGINGCLKFSKIILWNKSPMMFRRVNSPQKGTLSNLRREYHDSPTGGHSGYLKTYQRLANLKTYQRLAAECYWLGMRMGREIWKYVQSCNICQLSPSLEFVEGLPTSQGNDPVVVVDRLTKYANFLLNTLSQPLW